jgi:hypothetical protein
MYNGTFQMNINKTYVHNRSASAVRNIYKESNRHHEMPRHCYFSSSFHSRLYSLLYSSLPIYPSIYLFTTKYRQPKLHPRTQTNTPDNDLHEQEPPPICYTILQNASPKGTSVTYSSLILQSDKRATT